MIIGRLKTRLKANATRNADGVSVPILAIVAPETPSAGGVYTKILEELGAPFSAGASAYAKGAMVRAQLRKAGTRILLIDEAEHLSEGDSRNVSRCLHAIKDLSTELGISVVVAGGPEAVKVMTRIAAVENRFIPVILDRWDDGKDLHSFLHALSLALPLKNPSFLLKPAVIAEILKRSNGIAGEISAMVREAAVQAILNGVPRCFRWVTG